MALPMGLSAKSKQYKQIAEERKYYAKFLKLFGEESLTNNSDSKSLFVVQEKDVVTRKQDKNPWLEQLYTTNLICNDDNTIVTNNLSAHDIENVFRKNRDNIPNIENLFVFHSQNRGKITFSYNLDQLDRLNQYGVGIMNCFVDCLTAFAVGGFLCLIGQILIDYTKLTPARILVSICSITFSQKPSVFIIDTLHFCIIKLLYQV